MNNIKKVLIVSHQFPPDNGSIQRVLNHLNYMPMYNYLPLLITHQVENSKTIDESYSREGITIYRVGFKKSLFHRIYNSTSEKIIKTEVVSNDNSGLKIKRGLLTWFKNILFWPDIFIDWVPFAFFKILKVLRKHDIKLIYIISPPHSSNLLVPLIKLFTKSKVVIDFRDPWADDVDINHPTKLHKKAINYLEKIVCNYSDKVITTTKHHTNVINNKYPNKNNAITITNGFNRNDFNTPISHTDEFRIVYTGNFDSTRNPLPFLKVLSIINEFNPDFFLNVKIEFYGNYNPIVQQQLINLKIEHLVNQNGQVSYEKSIEVMMNAGLLLLVVHNDENTSKFSIPAKLFEYMATQRPILAITPKGEAQDIIEKLNIGKCFTHNDVDGIKDYILESYRNHLNGSFYVNEKFDVNSISKYDRVNLTRELIDVFDNIIK